GRLGRPGQASQDHQGDVVGRAEGHLVHQPGHQLAGVIGTVEYGGKLADVPGLGLRLDQPVAVHDQRVTALELDHAFIEVTAEVHADRVGAHREALDGAVAPPDPAVPVPGVDIAQHPGLDVQACPEHRHEQPFVTTQHR